MHPHHEAIRRHYHIREECPEPPRMSPLLVKANALQLQGNLLAAEAMVNLWKKSHLTAPEHREPAKNSP